MSLAGFLGFASLVIFFAADFFYARFLSSLKSSHPELEEYAPAESPDLDTAAVFDSLTNTATEFYHHQQQRVSGNLGEYTNPDSQQTFTDSPASSVFSGNPLHAVVVVCGVVGPVATLLSICFPFLMGWAFWHVPDILAIVVSAPGVAASSLYAIRVYNLCQQLEVSKSEWISMMWFRIDFMFIVAAVAFFGLGGWLLALCLLAVAAYLAHRIMKMEKHMGNVQRQTQLVRGEVDVTRVHIPGSKESRDASGVSEGYNALS
ncbi:hypothetical protein AGDE_03040 [Angomonas deanei]|uniref:Uncharacterized protein n=1 Tax=Angomonas deanei TaxID=59799 RepID=A0A7G2C444_9TRYP|nr:hypothetical protein AGDE_03040 [Angomonas deanei]CAD2213497.1 hypothetical protein, conserved [Angomonas deanei]|eukprot:EPY40886.1 hypothetical protein AGDE_03040 [Angomonas deanei]